MLILNYEETLEYYKISKLKHFDSNINTWPLYHTQISKFLEKVIKKYDVEKDTLSFNLNFYYI